MAIGRKTTRRRRIRRPRRSRRRFNRRRRISRKPTTMRIPGTIVPDRMFTKFRYVDTVTLGGFYAPTDTNSNLAFSYKDVVLTVGNPYLKYGVTSDDLPAGLSLWSQFYNQVAVTSAKVKVTPISWVLTTGTGDPKGSGMPYSVCLTPSAQVPIPTSATVDFLEQPYRRYKYFTQTSSYDQLLTTAGLEYVSAQSGNSVERSVSNTMTTKKMLGYKDLFDYSAGGTAETANLWINTDGTDITYPWYFVLTVKSAVPSTETDPPANADYTFPSMVVRIEVDYTVAFRDRTLILDSA